MLNARLTTHAFAIAVVLLIGSQAPSLAQPVSSGQSDPGLNPYIFNQSTFCPAQQCEADSPPVPAGKRLVIQRVSFGSEYQNPVTQVRMLVSVVTPTKGPVPVSESDHPVGGDGLSVTFDQPVLGYADAGSKVAVTSVPPPQFISVIIIGHLIDCTPSNPGGRPVNICAPIQP